MADFPRSPIEFPQRFPDEAGCAAYLEAVRRSSGFIRPSRGCVRGWALETEAWTHECGGLTSVTTGAVTHGSKLPLTAWFRGAHLMATHSNGISATRLQKQPGLGSHKSTRVLVARLRRAMVAQGRAPSAGLVEVDETEIPCRSKDGTAAKADDGPAILECPASIVDRAGPTFRPISTSSSSASTAAGPAAPRSGPFRASAFRSLPRLTRCWFHRMLGDKPHR